MSNDSEVIRSLKLKVEKLEAENKLMKLQLTPIWKIDFGWGNKTKEVRDHEYTKHAGKKDK